MDDLCKSSTNVILPFILSYLICLPLSGEGAMVKVTCQANDQALVGFGYTKNNGKYSVILKGLPISRNYGADSCKVELHAAPGGSECNVPIELNLSGLSIYSKSNEGVVLKANQILAFASKKSSGCSKPRIASFHQCIPIIPLHYLKTTIPCLHSATGPHHCLISIHHHLLTSFHR
jgi:hypothetical protein